MAFASCARRPDDPLRLRQFNQLTESEHLRGEHASAEWGEAIVDSPLVVVRVVALRRSLDQPHRLEAADITV